MGVQGLWDLTSPGARRVKLSTLEGRVVAVDASIWVAQFVKALRDPNGDMYRGAHLVGFFRRLCKLYYHRIRPIIVFDGPPPALKRRVLSERRRRREDEQLQLKKTAEKLISNIVKRKRAKKRADQGLVLAGPDGLAGCGRVHLDEEDEEMEALRQLLPKRDRVELDRLQASCGAGLLGSVAGQAPNDTDLRDPGVATPGGMAPGEMAPQEVQVLYEQVGTPPSSSGRESREDVLQVQSESRARRVRYYESIPDDFRGFLEKRRRLDEISVPTDIGSLLRMPERKKDGWEGLGVRVRDVDAGTDFKRPLVTAPDEFKEFYVQDDHGDAAVVQIPLNCEIDEGVFRALPHKMQFRILVQLRDQWMAENRLRAIASQRDPSAFSAIQMEGYLRTAHTNKEIEETKRKLGVEQLKKAGKNDPLAASSSSSSSEGSDRDDGGFMNFYAPEPAVEGNKNQDKANFERQLLAEIDTQEQEKRKRAKKKRERGKRKHLALFQEWEDEQQLVPPMATHPTWFYETDASRRTQPAGRATKQPSDPHPHNDRGDPSGQPSKPSDHPDQLQEEPDWEQDYLETVVCDDLPTRPAATSTPSPEAVLDNSESPIAEFSVKDFSVKDFSVKNTPLKDTPLKDSALKKRISMKRRGTRTSPPKPSNPKGVSEDEGWGDWDEADGRVKDSKDYVHQLLQEAKQEEAKQEEAKQEEANQEEAKQEEAKQEEAKQEEAKQEQARHTERMAGSRESTPGESSPGDATAKSLVEPRKASPAEVSPGTGGEREALDASAAALGESEASPTGSSPTGSSRGESSLPRIVESSVAADSFMDLSSARFERAVGGERQASAVATLVIREDEALEEEAAVLLRSLRRGTKRAAEVSAELYDEIRDLLRAFGIPFVNAPGEAEAQAAHLCRLGLAEAVVSDDSDCLVFGCQDTIRNLFDSDTTAELFSARDIRRVLGLELQDLRVLALLLGCDYTLGVSGIGVVNALEILQAWGNDLDALRRWAAWARDRPSLHSGQPGIRDDDPPLVKDYKLKHCNYRPHWQFPTERGGQFPPEEAYHAFIQPRVDHSTEPFHWVDPDLNSVTQIMHTRAGISHEKTQSHLEPILRRLQVRIPLKQSLLDTFIHPPNEEETLAEYRSARMKKAITIIAANRRQPHVANSTRPN
ncbi:putative endonuclease [Gregarina niphandrodes]|uniref:Endonuclease n=1 Tax=Gregarina niphandrodes TaxID=110365 RepID=A0A023BBR2_GRENI|nr:putative endonuclease [Gregarina niphandrodes]EZG80748.1 putative endonuclease [Gregarina niphandrodes]|eukprot:XP_011134286.1 putative endonuclease [Gregarina niphandrodes]